MSTTQSDQDFLSKLALLRQPGQLRAMLEYRLGLERSPSVSYAQSGEDLIARYIFKVIGIPHPSYLDIGAHHPSYLSNTALFYKTGSRGINVEPDPVLFTRFKKKRPKDTNLNIGVAASAGMLDFYLMDPPTVNTFSREESEKYLQQGYALRKKVPIAVQTICQVIDTYWHGHFPDFLTVDVEGIDMEIIRSIDFDHVAPKVICVETTTPADHTYIKLNDAKAFLETQGYLVYADTFINTIFLKRELWKNLY